MIYTDKVNGEIGFSTSQSTVEVCYMFARVYHKLVGVICAYENDNLFLRWAFGYYINLRSEFVCFAEDGLVDFFDFFV